MKRLIWLAFLLPYFATAQINGTIQKTVATKVIRGSFGSSGIDSLVSYTGALTDDYILQWDNALKKAVWVSMTASIDTTVYRTVANSVSLAGLQTRLNSYVALTGSQTVAGLKTFTTGVAAQYGDFRSMTGGTVAIGAVLNSDYTVVNNPKTLFGSYGQSTIRGGVEVNQYNGSGGDKITPLYINPDGVSTFYYDVIAPTQTAGNNSTKVATTAFVQNALSAGQFWQRTGTTLSPTTAGDYVSLTVPASGTALEINANSGSSNGISIATTSGGYGTRINNSGTSYGLSINASGASSSGHEIVLGSTNGVGINLNAASGYTGTPLTYSKNSATLFNVSNAGSVTISRAGNAGLNIRNASASDRLQLFVGDGTGGTTADENYILNNNTDLNITNTGGGVQLLNGATSWSAISDMRFKSKVSDLPSVLNGINQNRPFLGYYNANAKKTPSYMLSAQELQTTFPSVVDVGNDKDKTLSVKYTELIPVLFKAIQEQQSIITALEARIKALELKP